MIKITQNKIWALTWSGSLYEINITIDTVRKVQYDLKQLLNKATNYAEKYA
ncbi:hypothetical protein P344_04100 [Spiroplasma mirum ATCC 29335]|uniref:Uncharacterized protein n=1 Tax=Spiroplasma mirum ATCC 29335 TaxID=838561 RepID=W6ALG1_9MOLU|nr:MULTISPECIES: hypothetical protein [Spiroplasma]AHI58148.1 hypothetical protein P344_04100 [Spiroplasma mirum ATCC 29335]AKM53200.1 hypothetical protein SATRI_v1c07480 [Spiroplasma atrichopogonis]